MSGLNPFRVPRPGTRLPILVDTTTEVALAAVVSKLTLHAQRQVLALAEDIADAEARGETILRVQAHVVLAVAVNEAKG